MILCLGKAPSPIAFILYRGPGMSDNPDRETTMLRFSLCCCHLFLITYMGLSVNLILVAKSKMMLILSLHMLNCKRENRLRHQYQIDGEPYMGTTLIMKKDPLALTK